MYTTIVPKQGCLVREISRQLQRDGRTISRELKRNRGNEAYRYKPAQQRAQARRHEASRSHAD